MRLVICLCVPQSQSCLKEAADHLKEKAKTFGRVGGKGGRKGWENTRNFISSQFPHTRRVKVQAYSNVSGSPVDERTLLQVSHFLAHATAPPSSLQCGHETNYGIV